MSVERNEVAEMKEYMTLLMDVKVALAEQNGKLDSVLDVKKKVDTTYDIATKADNRSIENEKDIVNLKTELEKRASTEDVNKQNGIKNTIAIAAVLISLASVAINLI